MKRKMIMLPQWVEKIMKKKMSICSYGIFRTSLSLYRYSISRSKTLLWIVVLIAFMLTMLTGLIVNIDANWDKSQIRLMGSDAKLMLVNINEKQLKKLSNQKQIKKAGLWYPVQEADGFLAGYVDEVCWEFIFLPAVGEVKGNYPQHADEIMVSREYLRETEQEECNIGDFITIKAMGQFQITGIFTDYAKEAGVQNLYVSKEYASARNKLIKKNRRVMLASTFDHWYLEKIVKTDCDVLPEQIIPIPHQGVARDGTIILLKWILGFLFLCGGLSVYHIFYTVVSADQKIYGLFAVIGMSKEHIFQCMRWQSVFVAIPGVLLGVIMGLVGQIMLVPWFMKQFLAINQQVEAYLVTEVELYPAIPLVAAILIGSMVFAGVGVVAWRISKLSPMECLKGKSQSGNLIMRGRKSPSKKNSQQLQNSKASIRKLAGQYQVKLAGKNLLAGFSLFISNNFFLAVWVITRFFWSTDNGGTEALKRSDCIAVLGYFIAIVVFCTEIIRLWSITFIQMQTRKNQFALLRRIGMTEKQVKEMMMMESLYQFLEYLFFMILLEIPVWLGLSEAMEGICAVQMDFPWGLWLGILIIDFVAYIGAARILGGKVLAEGERT